CHCQYMHMPFWCMVVVLGCDPLHLSSDALLKRLHNGFCYLPQGKIALGVLSVRIRADFQAEKRASFFCRIYHAVCLIPSQRSVPTKQRPGDFCPVLSWPVLNISDIGFCASFAVCKVHDENCHWLP